ncbi:Werner syndrome ATP-dependent helicase-like [Cimex lectularius]|uniref:ATP-dependent DNA helicase n=1 Tax=Cimex lectularius TaxID=79782 RepID=A0A8I6REQ6_CIMLE|nr:Werner syndrome ATP-dependent helicase-like [Cimex lectularius]
MEPSEEHLAVLKNYFGHKEFRPLQWNIIRSIINDRRDNCVVMATGSGKSLCFQYPPVFCNGLGVVVSPLISLMEDQVLALNMCNIPATLLGTAQISKNIYARINDNEFRIVYVSPEWLTGEFGSEFFRKLKKKVKITLVAIDEAHCVSQWGMDFRFSYRKLRVVREIVGGDVPILAVTATATEPVQKDIISSLGLKNPLITRTSCDRPNLYLSASIKGSDPFIDIRDFLYKEKLNCSSNSSCIIYCPTKKKANKISDLLNSGGIKCSLYHADLSLSVRKRVHKSFASDEIQVIVATIAFGMGIDKPDVRHIIHYGAPLDIESYYQEIGRAGRDGLPAVCHVFYKNADFSKKQFFFSNLQGKYREHKEKMALLIEEYLVSTDCRRKMLVSHFDDEAKLEKQERCCDNCSKEKLRSNLYELQYDLTEDALLLLNAVETLGGNYGLQMAVFLLRGSSSKRFPVKYQSSKLFGTGNNKSDEYWKLLGNLLIRVDLLEEIHKTSCGWNKNNFPYKTLAVSENGKAYLINERHRKKVKLKPTLEMIPFIKKFIPSYRTKGEWLYSSADEPSSSLVDDKSLRQPLLEDLVYKEIEKFRCRMATSLDCIPYMVLSSRTMQLLAQKRPCTIEEMSKVEGITKKNVETFGKELLECITKCQESYKPDSSKVQDVQKNLKRFVPKTKNILSYKNDSDDRMSSTLVDPSSQSADDMSIGSTRPNELPEEGTILEEETLKESQSRSSSPSTVVSFKSAAESFQSASKESVKSPEGNYLSDDDDFFSLVSEDMLSQKNTIQPSQGVQNKVSIPTKRKRISYEEETPVQPKCPTNDPRTLNTRPTNPLMGKSEKELIVQINKEKKNILKKKIKL